MRNITPEMARSELAKRELQSRGQPMQAAVTPTTGPGAARRAAGTTSLEAISNLVKLISPGRNINPMLDIMSGEKTQRIHPTVSDVIPPKAGDAAHPIYSLLGGLAPMVALGGGTSVATRAAVPLISDLAKSSLIKRMLGAGIEGAGQGYAYSPPGQRTKGAIGGATIGALLPAAASAGRGVKALASKYKSLRDPEELQTEFEEAKKEHAEQKEVQQVAEARVGKSPSRAQVDLEGMGNKIKDLQDQLAAVPKDPEVPDLSTMLPDLSHETRSMQANDLLDNAKQDKSNINEEQSQLLSKDENGLDLDFTSRLGTGIKNGVSKIKSSVRPLYDDYKEMVDGKNITIPNDENTKELNKLLKSSVSEEHLNAMTDKDKEKWGVASELPTTKEIPASEYTNKYKATRDLANEANLHSYDEGINNDERNKWRERSKKLSSIKDKQYQVLKDHLPEDALSKLDEADSAWREKVIPFYNSSVYQRAKFHEQVPEDLIKKITGNAPHNKVMQQLIQSDPELNKLALGQRYYSKPSDLTVKKEQTEPYIQSHEPTSLLRDKQIKANENLENAQDIADKAKERANLERGYTENIAKQRQQEAVEATKKGQELEKTRKDLMNLITKHREDQSLLRENHDARMREIPKTKNKAKREEETAKAIADYNKRKDKLKYYLWRAAKHIAIYSVGYEAMRLLMRELFD